MHMASSLARLSEAAGSHRSCCRLLSQGGGSGEGKWASLSDNQAAVELFYRLRNCRQTVDFARRQRAAFAYLDKALLTIPQVLPPARFDSWLLRDTTSHSTHCSL